MMYTKPNAYEKSLCETARLFSLSKSDMDLFFVAQTNTITYQQLALTGIHGNGDITGTAGRLSLKRLENSNLIQSTSMPNNNHAKYYTLTIKGRERLMRVFPSEIFQALNIDFNRRPPTGMQQLPHRIRCNDFFYAYAAYGSLCTWQLEKRYQLPLFPQKEQLPRCDGYLTTLYGSYYIEQDNNTQSDTALTIKLKQYLSSDLFQLEGLRHNTLIFCLAFPNRTKPVTKPSYSLYRILLKTEKIWTALEFQYGFVLDYPQFVQSVEDSVALQSTLTPSELSALSNLKRLHPTMEGLEDVRALKNIYLVDTSYEESRAREMDQQFNKRLKTKFLRLIPNIESLRERLLSGMHLYVVPNHRLGLLMPYILPKECHTIETYMKCLYYMGMNTEGWVFLEDGTPIQSEGQHFYFSQILLHSLKSYIVIENIIHDLGGHERVLHFLRYGSFHQPILFLLLTDSVEHAFSFYQEVENHLHLPEKNALPICFLTQTEKLFSEAPEPAYFFKKKASTPLPVNIDFDDFTGDLHIVERQVLE